MIEDLGLPKKKARQQSVEFFTCEDKSLPKFLPLRYTRLKNTTNLFITNSCHTQFSSYDLLANASSCFHFD